jgi:hypothetical protein
MMATLEERLVAAPKTRRQFPQHSTCGRCGLAWPACISHSTRYAPSNACFPLCEDCWLELATPEARQPFYLAMIEWWAEMAPPDAVRDAQIIAAVMAGG